MVMVRFVSATEKESRTVGPFAGVKLVCYELQDINNGDVIAFYDAELDHWHITGGQHLWCDVMIYTPEPT